MTERDAENAVVLGILVLLLWRRTQSEVLIDYGGGFQPPITEPATPATPSGQTPVMNNIGIWIDPGSGYWWNIPSQSWESPVWISGGGNEGGGNSQEPLMPL